MAVGLVFTIWAGLTTWMIAFLHGPRTTKGIAALLSARLERATGQRVAIGDLDFNVFPPRVVLRRVDIGPAERPAVHLDEVEASLGPLTLSDRELVISALRLNGLRVDTAVPEVSGGRRTPWIRFSVRQLEVTDATVARLDLRKVRFRAENVEARWTGSRTWSIEAAVVQVGHLVVEAPGVEDVEGTIEARLRRSALGWEVGRFRGHGPGWELDGNATSVGRLMRARGTARVDLAELERVLHIGARLEGAAVASFEATVGRSEFTVDTTLAAERLGVVGFAFSSVHGEAHVSPAGVEGSLVRAGYAGGRLEGSYVLADFGPTWRHRIAARGEAVTVAGLLADLQVDAAGLAGAADLNADLSWDGKAIGEGFGTAIATLRPTDGDVPVGGVLKISLQSDATLQFATRGMTIAGHPAAWDGRLTLGDWVPSWSVTGDGVPVSAVRRMLLGWVGSEILPSGLTGDVAVALRLEGPFSDLSATGRAAVGPLSLGPVEVDGMEGTFAVGRGKVEIEESTVVVGRGRVRARGRIGYGPSAGIEVHVSGNGVPLGRAATWLGVHAPLSGRVALDGVIAGTLDEPEVTSRLALSDVEIGGVVFGNGWAALGLDRGVVTVRELEVGSLRGSATVDLAAATVSVEATVRHLGLDSISPPLARVAGSALDLTVEGTFPFDRPSGVLVVHSTAGASGRLELREDGLDFALERQQIWSLGGRLERSSNGFEGRFEFGVSAARSLLEAVFGGDVPVEGTASGDGRIVLARGEPPRVEGTLTRLALDVEGEQVELEHPAAFLLVGSAVSVTGVRVRGPGATFVASAGRSEAGSFSGNFSGKIPAALLSILLPSMEPRGMLRVEGILAGEDGQPRFEGTAFVEGGSIRVPGLPLPLTRIAGELEFVPEAIRLTNVAFSYGSSTGSGEGRIFISPQAELDLVIRTSGLRWPLITGFVPVLNGRLRLAGPLDGLNLSGDLTLERAVYRRDVNLQRLVIEEVMAPERVAATDAGALALNIRVVVPGTLEVNAPLARLTARGEVRIVGDSDRPGVLGRLESQPGGEVDLSGNRFELDRATVTFSNPTRIDPFLDVVARTTVQSAEITVSLIGTLDHLTPTFSSNPPLPEMDIVSFLSTGRRADEAGELQAGTFASTFLAEQLTGEVTKRARTLLDVDQLRVDPFLAQSENPTARLTVVKQLSRDWSVTLSTNLASNREEVVVSRWRLGQGFYLEANRDTDGSYGLEVKWQRRY